jgi:DNA repair exonuclease SbcCD ATPase subunit
VSDIQKLHSVIDALEEQASRVSEFSGVLSAVNSAKADISQAKTAFEGLAEEQKNLVSKSHTRFDEYGDKLASIESKLSTIERKILTTENFNVGRDKILLRMSELRFVTPEYFEQSIGNTERTIGSQITQSNSRLEELIATQEESIRSLRLFVTLGMFALASGIGFLAKDAFL